LAVEAQGIPLALILTGANQNDVTQLMPLVEAIPPIAGKPGRPIKRPASLQADRGYDSNDHRWSLHAMGIETQIARRNTENGSGLGVTRWVVERTFAWLHRFRRLRVRYERRADIHEAFMGLGACLICWQFHERLVS
jgi:transposase